MTYDNEGVACAHVDTFDCHGTKRCTHCHVDMLTLADGREVWPSQFDPASFTAEQIIEWFKGCKIYAMPPTCDGFEFARNNKAPGGATYGYIWIELTLDLDYEMAYLLDVRRHDGTEESRQYLFVTLGHHDTFEWHPAVNLPWGRPFGARNGTSTSTVDAIKWFAECVERWQASW